MHIHIYTYIHSFNIYINEHSFHCIEIYKYAYMQSHIFFTEGAKARQITAMATQSNNLHGADEVVTECIGAITATLGV